MFWGLIMEPNKRYTQVVEKPFHISQAAMDISMGDNDPCQVMVVVDGKNFLVCTLQKSKCVQAPLDLYFKTGDSISFLTNGKCNIHLTGYLDPEFEVDPSDEEEEEEEEEVPNLVAASKRKLENSTKASANKKAKKVEKKVAADSSDEDEDDDDDEDEDHLQKLLDGEDVDTDENDESFKVNTSAEADDSDDEDSDEAEAEESEEEEKEKDTSNVSMKSTSEIDMSKLSKAQKRRLKKKLQQQKKQQQQPEVNGVVKTKKEKGDGQQQKAEKKKQEGKKDESMEKPGEKREKKALSGGVLIEDLKVGAGPAAKPGKTVMVYYEGRLKQNNKMFDNCKKGAGFKFRLGAKEVISGWDVGISGMKVGGKRKIVCPPSMAYGAKGSPPVIPPNSTLVFEVELKEVK